MDLTPIDYDSIADIYDLYTTTDYDVPFFLSETAPIDGPVLELASGTGRLSLPLIESGVALTCVDRSARMLSVLSGKLRDRGLKARIVCADVCELDLPQKYEVVLFPFHSFMEIVGAERQRAVLSAVYACLKPGGRFICTLHNPAVRRRQVDGVQRRVCRVPFGTGALVVSGIETGGDPVVQRLQFFEFFDSQSKRSERKVLRMAFQLVEYEEFVSLASYAGFAVVDVFGDYGRGVFDAATSPAMIWILEKRANR